MKQIKEESILPNGLIKQNDPQKIKNYIAYAFAQHSNDQEEGSYLDIINALLVPALKAKKQDIVSLILEETAKQEDKLLFELLFMAAQDLRDTDDVEILKFLFDQLDQVEIDINCFFDHVVIPADILCYKETNPEKFEMLTSLCGELINHLLTKSFYIGHLEWWIKLSIATCPIF